MHKYPESVFEPLASARMLVYVLIIALVIVIFSMAWFIT
jgi:hypothetical protein